MSTRVGNLDVVHTQMLLIPKDKDAWVEFTVSGWDLKVQFVFIEDKDSPNKKAYRMIGNDDHARFEFKNWGSPLGMAFKEPIEIGVIDKLTISMMAVGYSFNGTMKLDLQFYTESCHE